MKKFVSVICIAIISPSVGIGDSLLSSQQFPSTLDDLSFSAKQELKAEDYALFYELDPYDRLSIVYNDQESAKEIAQDEQEQSDNENQITHNTTTVPGNNGTTTKPTATQNTVLPVNTDTRAAYCAIKNPALPAGQTVPIGKPVLASDYKTCSPYGVRNFGTKEKPIYDNHYGFDIGCTEKHYDRPVFTPADGTVDKVKYNKRGSSAGNYIRINHGNGFVTLYMHLNKILVTKGQRVSAGCQIGTIGNTGGAKINKQALQVDYPTMRKSISHLHYEMHYTGRETSVSGIPIKHGFSGHKSINPAYFMGVKK